MKKVLFVATVTRHILAFHIPYLKWFRNHGYEVHVASSGDEHIDYCDKHYNISFARFPIKMNNIKAYRELKKIIKENKYDIIHCHTPVGGVLTRLAARKERKKNNTKVIYTAHGFHFYRGAPLLNWIIYYPIEKFLSGYTDALITINSEDYSIASRKFKKAKKIYKINGVGVDKNKFNNDIINDEEKKKLKQTLNIKEDDYVIIYPAELSKRKNQQMLIKAINCMEEEEKKKIKVLFAGKDSMNGKYQNLAKKFELEKNIIFLEYRNDINKLMQIANLEVSTSKQEGLPVNVIEAMFMGLPIIATDCRGNNDLVNDCVEIDNYLELAKRIEQKIDNKETEYISYTVKKYEIEEILAKMKKIYMEFMKDE